ncbi:MAG: indolepyruvate ferredoxin oxidoreductase, partial [Proteobacteria bacterium]|nr:indolepyruvate ferredoxin oxidoreductase [Pseudomonadota bacterium]
HGKDILPAIGELAPDTLKPAIARLLGETLPAPARVEPQQVFPRPPTMCVACPHLGVYYTLSQLRNITIAGDIGCYTLGAGHPWNALDTTISMGASMGVALGLDKGRGESDKGKRIVAVRAVGMTGGQNNPANGRDIYGNEAPRVDFAKLAEALGVKRERIRVLDPYELPTLFKALREETKIDEPSVIITNRPCVLIEDYEKLAPYKVIDDKCTGCGNCVEVGCPAIHVTRREKVIKPSGKEVELAFVNIETAACTGCGLCVQPCAPEAIVPAQPFQPVSFIKPI